MGRWITALKKYENAEEGHPQNLQNPRKSGFEGFEGSGLSQIEKIFTPDPDDLWVQFEERAAILEYDGGYSRDDAERLAALDVYGAPEKKADET